jgi:hypothetical protein
MRRSVQALRAALGAIARGVTVDPALGIRPSAVTPKRRKWSGRERRWGRFVALATAWTVFAIFVVVFIVAALSWALGGGDGFLGVDSGCAHNAFGCNAAIEFLGTASVIAIAYVFFNSFRVRRVTKHHLKDVPDEPWRLVPTATRVDEVVGRDGICEIIETDLAQRDKSRPQVIVAGVGDGKTAVLVRLTQMLYEKGAVPVAVHLVEARDKLDFVELAKDRFVSSVSPRVLSDEEGQKVWRELCGRRLVVILADGLEEALPQVGVARRGTAVRLAIERARDDNMPLVIATRPDPALDDIDVALIRLEPLPTEAVLDYIRKRPKKVKKAYAQALADKMPEERLRRLIRTAEVLERPLYLQLTRDLYWRDRLSDFPSEAGRVKARFELLRMWREALVTQPEERAGRVKKKERQMALTGAEQMACVAMRSKKLEVSYGEMADAKYADAANDEPTAKVVAGLAEQLDLVEVTADGARFRHGIMQAYLGSCQLPDLVRNGRRSISGGTSTYLEAALDDPGRELLMALVMCCLVDDDAELAESLRETLRTSAEAARGNAAFELLAAAYEIDATGSGDVPPLLETTTRAVWTRVEDRTDRLETAEAKLRAILPMAEAGAYGSLWHVCQVEDAYAVRFQAAQALANSGEGALDVLLPDLEKAPKRAARVLVHTGAREEDADWKEVRRQSVLGWMMPLLAATSGGRSDAVHDAIEKYVKLVEGGAPGKPRLHLGVEAALAQGFKWEANRIPEQAAQGPRQLLVTQALALLDATHWWYSKVSILQALALWALDPIAPLRPELLARLNDCAASPHPYVAEVAKLCNRAIGQDVRESFLRFGRARHPSRYIWIDEVGLANKVGSKDLPPDEPMPRSGRGGLWIPPGAGWYALASGAQQLVADMLVFLNLVEGGSVAESDASKNERIGSREMRRIAVHAEGDRLPSCMRYAKHRDRLLVEEQPEDDPRDLRCPSSCGFYLCPYPAKAKRPFRGELPETFCRKQHRLLTEGNLPPGAQPPSLLGIPWKRGSRTALKRFWKQMEMRAED